MAGAEKVVNSTSTFIAVSQNDSADVTCSQAILGQVRRQNYGLKFLNHLHPALLSGPRRFGLVERVLAEARQGAPSLPRVNSLTCFIALTASLASCFVANARG